MDLIVEVDGSRRIIKFTDNDGTWRPIASARATADGEWHRATIDLQTIFSRAGIGRLTEQAVRAQDVPIVQGIVMFVAVCFVTVNFLVDIAYPLIDPRLRTVAAKGVPA